VLCLFWSAGCDDGEPGEAYIGFVDVELWVNRAFKQLWLVLYRSPWNSWCRRSPPPGVCKGCIDALLLIGRVELCMESASVAPNSVDWAANYTSWRSLPWRRRRPACLSWSSPPAYAAPSMPLLCLANVDAAPCHEQGGCHRYRQLRPFADASSPLADSRNRLIVQVALFLSMPEHRFLLFIPWMAPCPHGERCPGAAASSSTQRLIHLASLCEAVAIKNSPPRLRPRVHRRRLRARARRDATCHEELSWPLPKTTITSIRWDGIDRALRRNWWFQILLPSFSSPYLWTKRAKDRDLFDLSYLNRQRCCWDI
jgi:hypothetical protein